MSPLPSERASYCAACRAHNAAAGRGPAPRGAWTHRSPAPPARARAAMNPRHPRPSYIVWAGLDEAPEGIRRHPIRPRPYYPVPKPVVPGSRGGLLCGGRAARVLYGGGKCDTVGGHLWSFSVVSNWHSYEAPFHVKLRLVARNNWRKIVNLSLCCGHGGEPGC